MNEVYRWFLGYTLQEYTPHFSTVSYNFRHRFTAQTVDGIFTWFLEKVAEVGYLFPKAVFIDGTHIKASQHEEAGEGGYPGGLQTLCAGTDGRGEQRPGTTQEKAH